MSTDLDKITAAAWRLMEVEHRSWETMAHSAVRAASCKVAADYCAKMAEAAEGREKCKRGEHEFHPISERRAEYSLPAICARCYETIKPAPPADVTREEVEIALTGYQGPGPYPKVMTAMIRRVFADVLEGK